MTVPLLRFIRSWALLALIPFMLMSNQGLTLQGLTLSEKTFWAVWHYTHIPPWLSWILVLLMCTLVIPSWNRKTQKGICLLWNMLPLKNNSHLWHVILSVCAVPIFWVFRLGHLRWGDAQILVAGLAQTDDIAVIYNWQSPLTVYLHQRLWAWLFYPHFGWGMDTVYAFVSVLCGGMFVFVLLNLAHDFARTPIEKSLIVGLVLTTGTMQLFFGYVENYTIISLGIVVFLWLGLHSLQGKVPLWAVTLSLSITNCFHPSTVILWFAVIYLVWVNRHEKAWHQLLLELILPPLIISSNLLMMMELGNHGLESLFGDDRPGGSDHIWFVPLFNITSDWETYTMFSMAHLTDWANLHFLLSVFGLPVLGIIVWNKMVRLVSKGHTKLQKQAIQLFPKNEFLHTQCWFLGIASLSYLLFTWVWNADYGIRKDWDLFSPSAIVYSLLLAWLFIETTDDKDTLAQGTIVIVAVSALHAMTWIVSNT
ncbi:MAG: hypothetical protein B6242_10865 [Anaerolineaceae bacterium 4572_78]|nr:MAG: hypothetical protein B6242_10865 [Anaerolineaceae bacterium 4572_78]